MAAFAGGVGVAVRLCGLLAQAVAPLGISALVGAGGDAVAIVDKLLGHGGEASCGNRSDWSGCGDAPQLTGKGRAEGHLGQLGEQR